MESVYSQELIWSVDPAAIENKKKWESFKWVLPKQRTDSRNTISIQVCMQIFLSFFVCASMHIHTHTGLRRDTHIHVHTVHTHTFTSYWLSSYRKHPFHTYNDIKEIRTCFPKRHLFDIDYGSVVKNLPANAGDSGNAYLIPALGSSPRIGNGNLLQYTCLENSMDQGPWWAAVHGVAKSSTWLSSWAHTFWIEDHQGASDTRKALYLLFASEQKINLQKCLPSFLYFEGLKFIIWNNFRPLPAFQRAPEEPT